MLAQDRLTLYTPYNVVEEILLEAEGRATRGAGGRAKSPSRGTVGRAKSPSRGTVGRAKSPSNGSANRAKATNTVSQPNFATMSQRDLRNYNRKMNRNEKKQKSEAEERRAEEVLRRMG
jgi:hypothetical protein